MTHQDAVEVVEAVRGVDGDCGSCVRYVCVKLVKAFPALDWWPILIQTLVSRDLWDHDFVAAIIKEAGE